LSGPALVADDVRKYEKAGFLCFEGREICTVPQSQFDNLRFYRSFLECVGGKWRLNDAGKVAARAANGD
jgi:hypothetical protein